MSNPEEINVIDVLKAIWLDKWLLVKAGTVFLVLGVIIALTSSVEYESSSKMIIEGQGDNKSGLSGLGSLAGLAGINLDLNSSGSISPQLYPEVIYSVPFQREILDAQITFSSIDSVITLNDYFELSGSSTSSGIINSIKNLFGSGSKAILLNESSVNNGLIKLDKEEWLLIENMRSRILISISESTGIINIVTTLPDPLAAAELNRVVLNKLSREIAEYRTEKALNNLEFVVERYKEAELSYKDQQRRLAQYIDMNRNLAGSVSQTEYKFLQNDLNVAFEVYKGLSSQLEQARIKVKEDTPIFTTLESPVIPVKKSKPKRTLIVIGSILVGVFLSLAYIVLKFLLRQFSVLQS